MPPLPLITLSETYTYSIGGDHVIPATRVGDVVVGSESENVLLHCFLSSFFSFQYDYLDGSDETQLATVKRKYRQQQVVEEEEGSD